MTTPQEIAARAAPKPTADLREPKLAIALSGGGYRAMLYHLGALRRLNEFGLLSVMDRLSTVSGGSLAGAVLGMRWSSLTFGSNGVATGFEAVETDVMAIADHTIDVASALVGFLPWTTGAAQVARRLDRRFKGAQLGDLSHERPRFTFNTTNQQTGNLFRWAPGYGADHEAGLIEEPTLTLARTVAASAAFPPWLSPLRVRVPGTLVDPNTRVPKPDPPEWLWLTDGGVYDNLGVETLKSFHTILASDGGAPFHKAARLRKNPFSQSIRTTFTINDHVGRLRRRTLVHEFDTEQRLGALWTISTTIGRYDAPDLLPCPDDAVRALAGIKTRLRRVDRKIQHRLMNWGYASADAAIRTYVEPSFRPPASFPYEGGIG